MTDQPDQPVPKRRRRRTTTPAGHSTIAPDTVGQGVQVDAAVAAQPKRRGSRKRAAVSPIEQASAGESFESLIDQPLIEQPLIGQVNAASATPEPASNASAAVTECGDVPFAKSAMSEDLSEADARMSVDLDDVALPSMLTKAELEDQITAIDIVAQTSQGQTSQNQASQDPNQSSDTAQTGLPASERNHHHQQHALADDHGSGGNGGGHSGDEEPPDAEHNHHRWVYLAMALFVVSLAFGAWGVSIIWSANSERPGDDPAALQPRADRLSQEVSTLRRSDQISRDANRDLQRTLAERDEEISGLRADVAFYERFVGATGQRRGLSVHDLNIQPQIGEAWHFAATLTQNLNRGAINSGRLLLSVEGTRNERLERLPWGRLRQQNAEPGVAYSFKYFQRVEGDVMLPKDFKPLRLTVRLVPADGSAVEQSFAWAETLHKRSASD